MAKSKPKKTVSKKPEPPVTVKSHYEKQQEDELKIRAEIDNTEVALIKEAEKSELKDDFKKRFDSLLVYFDADTHSRQKVPELKALRDDVLLKLRG